MTSKISMQTLEINFAEVLRITTSQDRELTDEESRFVENTLKEILNFKKSKVAEVESPKREGKHSPKQSPPLSPRSQKEMKKDLFYYCMDVVGLVDNQILPKTRSAHGRVFFLKVKGDFLRYSAESVKKSDSYKVILQEGLKAYSMAYEIATKELPPQSSVYLNLCLNFSVFYYVVMKDSVKACQLASKTLIELKRERDVITEEVWRSIQPIKCLLKNNLIFWLSN